MRKAFYHLPGLFEFYELYSLFLPLFSDHREWFYEWCDIGSIYGSPEDCLWGGGRIECGQEKAEKILELMQKYKISARLTFSNSLIEECHLNDTKCNKLCKLFEQDGTTQGNTQNGVIVHSELLLNYLKVNYPNLYAVSSTTKVITDFSKFVEELDRKEFLYVVPDFRLNKMVEKLNSLSDIQKDKVEFLCNECCDIRCTERKACYQDVSRKNIGLSGPDHICPYDEKQEGYLFSKAINNPSFIGIEDIQKIYLPNGFTNFKIEGRSLGSALVLEFLLYYLTKPEYHINVREKIYLENTLDLF